MTVDGSDNFKWSYTNKALAPPVVSMSSSTTMSSTSQLTTTMSRTTLVTTTATTTTTTPPTGCATMGSTYTVGSATYSVACGAGPAAPPTITQPATTFAQCIDLCYAREGCLAASFDNIDKLCALYDSVPPFLPGYHSGWDTAVWIPPTTSSTTTIATTGTSTSTTTASTITTTSSTTTQATSTIACTDVPNPYTAPNGDTFKLYCDQVPSGTDSFAQQAASDNEECMDLCSTTDNCVGTTFVKRSSICLLYSTVLYQNLYAQDVGDTAILITTGGTTTMMTTTTTTTTTTTSTSATTTQAFPTASGSCESQIDPFTISTGEEFNKYCGQTWSSNENIDQKSIEDYGACAEFCGQNADCTTFLLMEGTCLIYGGTAHLYSPNSIADSGVKTQT